MTTETNAPERELTEAQKLLNVPITSRDQLAAVIDKLEEERVYINSSGCTPHQIFYDRDNPDAFALPQHVGWLCTAADTNSGDSWWLLREMLREQTGLYPQPTPTLEWLRSASGMAGSYFPHISKTDPTMVAFTPDHNSGVNDRQVRTTIGKLLRRFLPLMSDTQIADMESRHRAELSDEFKVAESIEEVERVYTTMKGDSGCMRYKKSNWDFKQYHPSAVYASPETGVRVAYLENGAGQPIARTVIYDNPADPADKRYVRLYGAHKRLEAMLKRHGYRMAGLRGAKIRALCDSSFRNSDDADGPRLYVMPYLDIPGGAGAGCDDNVATYVMLEEGSEYITVGNNIDVSNMRALLRSEGQSESYAYANAQSTGGSVALLPTPGTNAKYTCIIDGREYRSISDPRVRWLDNNGVLGYARRDNLTAVSYGSVRALHNGRLVPASAALDNEHTIYVVGAARLQNHPEALRLAEVVTLSPKHYPEVYEATMHDSGCWAVASATTRTYEGEVILSCDSVALYDYETTDGATFKSSRCAHKGDVRRLRKLGYVSTPQIQGVRRWIKTGHPHHVVTSRGRDAIIGVHNLAKLASGKWEFASNVDTANLLGFSAQHDKELGPGSIELGPEFLDRALSPLRRASAQAIAAADLGAYKAQALCSRVRAGAMGYYAMKQVADSGGAPHLAAVSTYSSESATVLYPAMVSAARRIVDMDDDQLRAFGVERPRHREAALLWARSTLTLDAAADALLAQQREAAQAAAAVVSVAADELLASAA